jgi:hypothetical protein
LRKSRFSLANDENQPNARPVFAINAILILAASRVSRA